MGGLRNSGRPPQGPPVRRADVSLRGVGIVSDHGPGRGRGADSRPPLAIFLLCLMATLIPVGILLIYGLKGHVWLHSVGALSGMIIGIVLMGLNRRLLNERQSGGRFADWQLSASRLGTITSASGWIFGLVNLVIFAIELSRQG